MSDTTTTRCTCGCGDKTAVPSTTAPSTSDDQTCRCDCCTDSPK